MGDRFKNTLVVGLLCLSGFLMGFSFWTSEKVDLTWGIVGDPPRSLDPIRDLSNRGRVYSRALFSSLYESRCGKLVPLLVEYERKISNRVVVLGLRRGVRFHNGRELIADDVVFSMHYLFEMSKGNTFQKVFGSKIKDVRVRSRYELEIELSPIRMDFRKTLLFPILPKKEVLSEGVEFWQHPIGSGPFRFDKWTKDEIVLVRNEKYFGGVPKIKRLRIRFFSSQVALLSAILAGKVQVTVSIPCRYCNIVGDLKGVDVERTPDLRAWALVWVGKGEPPGWFRWMKFLFSEKDIKSVACIYKWLALRTNPDRFVSLMEEDGWKKRNGFWEKDGRGLIVSIYLFSMLKDELWPLAVVKKLRASGILARIVSSPREANVFIGPILWLGNQEDRVLDLLYLNMKAQQLFDRPILSHQENNQLINFFWGEESVKRIPWLLRTIYLRRFIFLFVPQRFSMRRNGLRVEQGCSFYEMTSSCLPKIEWEQVKERR